MASDTNAPDGEGRAPPLSAEAGDRGPARRGPRGRLARLGAAVTRRIDALAADDRRRLVASLAAALLVNAVVLVTLGVFGRVQIWAPNAPARTISIVFVEEEIEPLLPELRDPETVPEPEPEEADIVEEPELEDDEPEPEPAPEPEEAPPEPEPEAFEPEEAPEPVLDLPSEEEFAPPGDLEEAPFIPEGAPREEPGPLDAAEAEPGENVTVDQSSDQDQTPAEEIEQLIDRQELDAGLDVAEADAAEDGEMNAGEEAPFDIEGRDEAVGEADEGLTGDDMFDEAPRFVQPRSALPLPSVDLPEGQTPAIPGQSGVVAIFCPEEFDNEDKQKECAGRTQIRSGWRPGASGETWDEAVRLLKRERRSVGVGGARPTVLPTAPARRQGDERRAGEQGAARRRPSGLNNLPQSNDNLGDALARPNTGPDAPEPTWAKREDPVFDQSDIDDLKEALEEAEIDVDDNDNDNDSD